MSSLKSKHLFSKKTTHVPESDSYLVFTKGLLKDSKIYDYEDED